MSVLQTLVVFAFAAVVFQVNVEARPHDVARPTPTANVHSVLVFVNPKSGGNHGADLLKKFEEMEKNKDPNRSIYVVDITKKPEETEEPKEPEKSLMKYGNELGIRVLVLGGDGTAGWVLSVMDKLKLQLKLKNLLPVAVQPLGTGNDLAHVLGWGGTFQNKAISEMLEEVDKADEVYLDRWRVSVKPNIGPAVKIENGGENDLPLQVFNNYFSIGVDAKITLEFHNARNANPEWYQTTMINKAYYAYSSFLNIISNSNKDLSELVTVKCKRNGKMWNLTKKLKEHEFNAVVFLNIPSYGGGVDLWDNEFEPKQDKSDGMIEVIGLTALTLASLPFYGHGYRVNQCESVEIVTSAIIPMQVDGEPRNMNPSTITISHNNVATMLEKHKQTEEPVILNPFEFYNPMIWLYG